MEKLDSKIDHKLEKLANVEKEITTRLEEKIEEKTEHDKRKDNIVVWNIPESEKENTEERQEEDTKAAYEILGKTTELDKDSFSKIERLGKKGNRPRLLRITVKSPQLKEKIVKNQRKVNEDHTDRQNFNYINHDLTPAEREKERKAREELKAELKRRQDQGEKNIGIRGKSIVNLKRDTDGQE